MAQTPKIPIAPERSRPADRPTSVRIIHGDCLDELRKIPNGSVDAIVSDPPFGVDDQPHRRADGSRLDKIAGDAAPPIWFLPQAYRVLKYGGAMLIFVRYDVEATWRWGIRLAGFRPRAQIVWDKVNHGMGDARGDWAPRHENIVFATKGRFVFPGKRPSTVLRHKRLNGREHPHEKPIALMADLTAAVTSPGDLVLDPFLGSGATACAAYQLGRRFVGIELEAKYIALAERRLEELVREREGR